MADIHCGCIHMYVLWTHAVTCIVGVYSGYIHIYCGCKTHPPHIQDPPQYLLHRIHVCTHNTLPTISSPQYIPCPPQYIHDPPQQFTHNVFPTIHICVPTKYTHNTYSCMYCGCTLWVHTYILWV